jgi:selenide, water dikinase
MGPGALHDVLAGLRLPTSPNLIIGLDVSDDAAVYRIAPDTALVQTVDFFPPVVDDPYTYGAIAAANSLSDVYAMGGRPMMALAVAAFPDNLPLDIVRAIMQGGADKVAEAGAVLAGGHTVIDREPKYGLAVTGTVHPDQVLAKANAQPGDLLLLTKPLGTGLITTALKRDVADAEHVAAAVHSMLRLNKRAAELTEAIEVHSATDITGYGLLGHAAEIARNSGVGLRFDWQALPILPGALGYAGEGAVPGGLLRNQQYLEAGDYVRYRGELSTAQRLLLFDPQTSGGLLLALPPAAADAYGAACAAAGQFCCRVGEVVVGSGIEIWGE